MTVSPGQLELSVLLDRLPEAVFTVDAGGCWTYVSRAFTDLTGIPATAAVGERADALVLQHDRDEHRPQWAALLAGEAETLRLVHRVRHADGTVRWIEARAQVRRDATGRPAGATGILTDVTERRVAERHARAEQAVTAMLVADHPAEHAVQALLATLGEELEWDTGELWTQNASATTQLRCTQAWARDGALPGSLDDIAAVAPGEGLPGRAWSEGVPVWATGPAAPGVAFPVASGGRPLAVIALYSRTPRAPEPGLDPVLTRVGAHAGSFIDRKIAQRRMAEQADDLAVLGRVAHRLAEQTDGAAARAAICEAARDVADAACALLFEPGASGSDLFVTAAVGTQLPELAVSRADTTSGTAAAYRTGHAQFVPRLGDSGIEQRLVRATGLRSAMWQPVIRGGEAVGVIAVGWTAEVTHLPDRVPGMLQVLAADAAVAFERAAVLERLTSMALSDELTGLPNRRAWQRELERELARARRYESPLCLALLDLDRFKRFNDARGHQAGDELLTEAASAWRQGLRPTDTLARYGGEEFALLLPHTSIDAAQCVVERLRAVTPFGQTCSAGLVCWDPAEDAAELVRRADVALYDAKASGRDRTVTSLPAAAYNAFSNQ